MRPAAAVLAAAAARVTVVSRRAPVGEEALTVVRADLGRPGTLVSALGVGRRFDAVLAYAPWATADNRAGLSARADETLVHVLVSAWAAPGTDRGRRDAWAPAGRGRTVRLILGWAVDDRGATRWHTPQEVSDAALAALRGGPPEQRLGLLEPWGERPR